MTPNETPLSTVDPESISRLTSKPTSDLTESDIVSVIAFLRKQRLEFIETEKAEKKKKAAAPKGPKPKLTLSDLFS